MTKEDCLNKSILDHHDSWVLNDSVDFFDGYASSVFKAMEEYAKEVALKFYEYEESVPPENMEKHFDYFFEKFKSDYGI